MNPLVGYLTGPTAVGKSEVGLLLAERKGWAILSVDSRQIYRGLERGTAKPTREERSRVLHLLVDFLDPHESCSAGAFRRWALKALVETDRAGRRTLAVGGAGLYWEALTQNLHPLPAASPETRKRHEEIIATHGVQQLHALLQKVDPESASRLEPNDRQRVGRALEVFELTGVPLSHWIGGHPKGREAGQEAGPDAHLDLAEMPVVALMRPRSELYERIESRCRRMLDAGLVDELDALLRSGVRPDAPGLRTVGYREFLPHLISGVPLDHCRERFLRNSRRYAKRQETWLRHRLPERREIWLEPGETAAAAAERVESVLATVAEA